MVIKSLTEVRKHLDASGVGVVPKYVPLQQKVDDMSNIKIGVVAGDGGGLNALLPVLALAKASGYRIDAFLTATCRDKYLSGTLQLPDINVTVIPEGSSTYQERLSDAALGLLLVAASQSQGGVEVAHTCIKHVGSIPILGVEDMYGSMGPLLSLAPDALHRLCVIDQYAADMVTTRHPSMQKRVVVTGGPQFDKGIEIKKNWDTHRSRLRTQWGVSDDTLVFLIAGGINGTSELLDVVEGGISQEGIQDQARILLREHSRSTKEDKELLGQYLLSTEQRLRWIYDTKTPTDDVLPGVDFVISGYSTVNRLAILYGIPGTVYVGTSSFRKDLREEKGLDYPPEISADAGWYVSNHYDMAGVIQEVLDPEQAPNFHRIRSNQKKIAQHFDGNAAQRVFDEMQHVIISPM